MDYLNNDLLVTLSFWGGLAMTLLIFSALLGDQPVARLGQHLLVGASLGYLGVLAVQHVLRPRLITPLLADPTGDPWRWVPVGLGTLLLLAGLDHSVRQTQPGRTTLALWRRALHGAGRIPVALLLAVGLSAGFFGLLQGTFLPQFWRAAQMAFEPAAPVDRLVVGVLTLLITTATLLYLYIEPQRYLVEQPFFVQRLLRGWLWLGQRALWLAAGFIFARLMASRLSLLIARVDYLVMALYETPLWRWLASLFG